MRRSGGGFGFIILLLVLAVVFYAAMRNFQAVAPAAMEVQKHNAKRRVDAQLGDATDDPNQTQGAASRSSSDDSWTPSAPSKPTGNLEKMDQATTQHTEAVKDSLSQSN
ncbi:MAG TPA: hypothetical protein VFV19_09375 [Candidatus Polarisedimenticolaceae bacterium]|nr:hypothetical protein [Candidatus Polarisedimenticolaceae bacterium]